MKYLIIGNGRLAKHLNHYLQCLNCDVSLWHRNSSNNSAKSLESLVTDSDRILLAMSDDQLESFYQQNHFLKNKLCLHFSGAKVLSIPSAHPLMTFSSNLYEAEFYKSIPFVIEAEGPSLNELLPDIKNKSFKIPKLKKPLYHALCVMSGNFASFLWTDVAQIFKNELNLPQEILIPYLMRNCANLIESNFSPEIITGPLVRQDEATMKLNISSLSEINRDEIYSAFKKYALTLRGQNEVCK